MEKKKLLKNKIVDTLPVLYLETVILMVLGQSRNPGGDCLCKKP